MEGLIFALNSISIVICNLVKAGSPLASGVPPLVRGDVRRTGGILPERC